VLGQKTQGLDGVVRALATAGKALRLYPPTSPIPRESVQTAVAAITERLAVSPIISFVVAREGFTADGEPLGASVAGAAELADSLRAHGVAELDITGACTADELLAFLQIAMRPAEEVRAEGGLGALLVSGGVECLRVADVHLTVLEGPQALPDQDIDEFLRSLASDPDKLAAWMASASSGDLAAFGEGLLEIAGAAGMGGLESFITSLAGAFGKSESFARDALMELAMEPGDVRNVTASMFGMLPAGDIAGAVLEGTFGKNMLSLSSALTNLPLDRCTAEVRAQVQAMLPGTGHTDKEASFLSHMIDVRARTTPEPALVDADQRYRAVAQAASLGAEDVSKARDAVMGSQKALSAAGVRTMLMLLDQQQDFELYSSAVTNLANLVPRLVEQGQVPLAGKVVAALAGREGRASGPWPDLSTRLREALAEACGPRTMTALVRETVADPALVDEARQLLRYGGEPAAQAFATEAVAAKAEGLAIAEQVLGRRLVDALNALAPRLQWFQLGPVAARLAQAGDPRSLHTIEQLLARDDEQSRREVVSGLASAGAPPVNLLSRALSDPSTEVAIIAARSLSRSGAPNAARALVTRLDAIDIDNADFLLGREIIGGLARLGDPAAEEALRRIAGRKALIKRGHFAETCDLARRALLAREQAGAAR